MGCQPTHHSLEYSLSKGCTAMCKLPNVTTLHYRHSLVSIVVADGLVPILRQVTYIDDDDGCQLMHATGTIMLKSLHNSLYDNRILLLNEDDKLDNDYLYTVISNIMIYS